MSNMDTGNFKHVLDLSPVMAELERLRAENARLLEALADRQREEVRHD